MIGTCRKHNPFRGLITISEKGQIVIPSALRKELELKRGDRLIILKRKDDKGFVALKENVIWDKLNELIDTDWR